MEQERGLVQIKVFGGSIRYPVITEVCKEFGYGIEDDLTKNWDLYWSDILVPVD